MANLDFLRNPKVWMNKNLNNVMPLKNLNHTETN